jgi:uncharacterized membrane protein
MPSRKPLERCEISHRNIEVIGLLAKESLAKRNLSARIGDFIAAQAGRMWFINLHVVWFALWVVFNKAAPAAYQFDPFPFALLTMIVSLEAIFLSLFVLMSQTRSGLQADDRNQLDLQINLLSEHENTKMLQMLQAICTHHGLAIAADDEVAELVKRTDPRDLLEELKRNLP